jgi:glucose/arabinose dehydrogenase
MRVRVTWLGILPFLLIPLSARAVQFPSIELEVVASGVTRPVYVTHAGDGSGRLFIVEQPGRVRVMQNGLLQVAPFLDIDARVAGGNAGGDERGLLGLAFPPQFNSKQYFYVYYYSSSPNEMILSRFYVSTNDMNMADASDEEIILKVFQPEGNHNGGQLSFGMDGYLYLGPGDGGGGNDDDAGHGAIGNGQRRDTLLGKILRIDVETPPITNDYQVPYRITHLCWIRIRSMKSGRSGSGIPTDSPLIAIRETSLSVT